MSQSQNDVEAPGETTPLLNAKGKDKTESVDFIGRLFMRHENPTFADNAELAVRAAFWLVLLTLPYKIESIPVVSFLSGDLLSGSFLIYVIYTLYKSVGQTIYFAWGGIVGTFFGSITPWIMFGFFPGGVKSDGDGSVFYFGAAFGTVYIISILWLNLDLITQIFALNTFVWHWMGFMDPNTTARFNGNFEINMSGQAVAGLIVAIAGCLVAIVVTLFPTPITSAQKARVASRLIASELSDIWLLATNIYCANERDLYGMDEINHRMQCVNEQQGALSGHLDSAWWECLGWGRIQRTREMLAKLDKLNHEFCDRLTVVVAACETEEFESDHVITMSRVKSCATDVVREASALMTMATDVACSGKSLVSTDARLVDLRKAVERLTSYRKTMAKEFHAAKIQVNKPELHESLLGEHTFVFSLGGYAAGAETFATQLLDYLGAVEVAEADASNMSAQEMTKQRSMQAAQMFAKRDFQGISATFDRAVLFERVHLNFAFRNSFVILTSFFVGLHGYNKMIPAGTAGIAGTAAILLSKFSGSALKNNLNRLQGVVLGVTLGMMLYALFGWNEPEAIVFMLCLEFVWIAVTLFTYYDSANYGTICLLMAAFGTNYFLRVPSNTKVIDPQKSFYTIIDVVLCIAIMMMSDTVFGLGRPSKMAHTASIDCWKSMENALDNLFNKDVELTRFHKGILQGKIAQSSYLGSEASEEPRGWRRNWPTSVFEAIIKSAYKVRVNLSVMEYCAAEGQKDGGKKTQIFSEVTQIPSFRDVLDVVKRSVGDMSTLMNVVGADRAADLEFLTDQKYRTDIVAEINEKVKLFIEDANNKFELDKGAELVSNDSAAQINTIVDSLVNIVTAVCESRHSILCCR